MSGGWNFPLTWVRVSLLEASRTSGSVNTRPGSGRLRLAFGFDILDDLAGGDLPFCDFLRV